MLGGPCPAPGRRWALIRRSSSPADDGVCDRRRREREHFACLQEAVPASNRRDWPSYSRYQSLWVGCWDELCGSGEEEIPSVGPRELTPQPRSIATRWTALTMPPWTGMLAFQKIIGFGAHPLYLSEPGHPSVGKNCFMMMMRIMSIPMAPDMPSTRAGKAEFEQL